MASVLALGTECELAHLQVNVPLLLLRCPSTGKVWQTLNTGKSPRVPNSLVIYGAVIGEKHDSVWVWFASVPALGTECDLALLQARVPLFEMLRQLGCFGSCDVSTCFGSCACLGRRARLGTAASDCGLP